MITYSHSCYNSYQMQSKIIFGTLLLASLLIFYRSHKQIDSDDEFHSWMANHQKFYSPQEWHFRRLIFHKNLELIRLHNQDDKKSYSMAANKFADLTNDEFINLYLNRPEDGLRDTPSMLDDLEEGNDPLPNGIDYRGLTAMKNQGQCGAGWAFAVVGSFEGYYRIYQGKSMAFSEQNLIDCDKASKGCTSGSNYNGYTFMKSTGIQDGASYPYVGEQQNCRSSTGKYKIQNFSFVGSEYALKKALTTHPASAGVDAQKWQFYKSGVFGDCGLTWNHYVGVVGYEDSGNWILKNSWGEDWGEQGYIRIKPGNTCGVLSQAYQNVGLAEE